MSTHRRLATLGFALVVLTSPAWSQQPSERSGIVFLDRNANGAREPGEPGLPGVAVSDLVQVVVTEANGAFRLPGESGYRVVFVSVPDGFRAVGPFWRRADDTSPLTFALADSPSPVEFSFIHASDPHLSEASLPRMARLRAVVDSIRPAFVLISGDLVRDALRVPEPEARSYYEMYVREVESFPVPVYSVPGNHENFGVERHLSLVPPTHPLYGRAMFRHYLGPDYYSFTYGGVHFVGLNSVDYDDLWYYGQVDSTQLAWLERDLALVPATTPVITFNHIPFVTSALALRGYTEDPPAPTLITVKGRTLFRHTVSNARAVFDRLKGRSWPLALGGHLHMREVVSYEGMLTRFAQAAAVVGPSEGAGLAMPSGVTVYRVRAGRVDEGRFVPF